MNSVDRTSRDDYGATFITDITPLCDAMSGLCHEMNYARAQDKAADRKVIAKILPRYTRQLMVVIKHNEGAGSQL
jgi:hypothetical protein